jgi:hypothetical protein
MSPVSQYTALVTLVAAILGFALFAYIGLGLTLVLLLYGFRVDRPPAPPAPPVDE